MSQANLDYYQCKWTSECQNSKCFWKQRDCYGLQPFPMWRDENGEYPAMKKNERIRQEYGDSYFPKLNISVGTNTYHIYCEDYIETT